ncbi:helix-turn-helix domain-containing protein [Mycobacteroides abscessus]|uniref:helix-turn-helix domain-containing protein n=1 Tax=Mycobacteroides abscessus TaxID=36809 RepID=UPI0019D167FC|nr:helix-turn-helix domain-containing protein [Mycobacteroides abscessus]MBN7296590.1 helix-turn-helix domain-containing protein [Mycobacteroides abscessus subsp. abscessus]
MSHWVMDEQRTIPPGLPGKFFEHAIDDPNLRIRIAQRALAGESLADLATVYGISVRTVMRYRDALAGGE